MPLIFIPCRIVDKLSKFVPVRNDVLLMSVLRLLHNLSFDSVLRDAMVKNGMIPKVCAEGGKEEGGGGCKGTCLARQHVASFESSSTP